MSVLSDVDIIACRNFDEPENRWLDISPWNDAQLQPASYDLTLGQQFLVFGNEIEMIEPWNPQNLWEPMTITDDEEFILGPGEFVLGTTVETLSLNDKVTGEIWGKSSLGRLGLSIHVTAGFVDPGFSGQITLEFFNVSPVPIALRPGMRVAQVVFAMTMSAARRGYSGKYVGQTGVTASRYHLNYEE